MRANALFLGWMLGYPLVCSVDQWVAFLIGRGPNFYSDGVNAFAAFMTLAQYYIVACLLYERRP